MCGGVGAVGGKSSAVLRSGASLRPRQDKASQKTAAVNKGEQRALRAKTFTQRPRRPVISLAR